MITQSNLNRLYQLANEALFKQQVFNTKFGQQLNIYDLLHTTSINQLVEMELILKKKIEAIETDEWIDETRKLPELRQKKELVNLVIGFKRWNIQQAENSRKKEELTKKLNELKESIKTPEERIKELEAQIASL